MLGGFGVAVSHGVGRPLVGSSRVSDSDDFGVRHFLVRNDRQLAIDDDGVLSVAGFILGRLGSGFAHDKAPFCGCRHGWRANCACALFVRRTDIARPLEVDSRGRSAKKDG